MFNVDYHGGAVISNVNVQPIFYGSAWYSDSGLQADAAQLDAYFNFITQSSYMDMLAEYDTPSQSIGRGSVAGNLAANTALPSVLDDSRFQSDLNTAIYHGNIARPNANELYFIFTPPDVVVTMGGGNSVQTFLGYHNSFTDYFGDRVRYAVIPHPIGNGDIQGLNAFQQQTVVSSHELAEAVTDPDPPSGWVDPSQQAGEIGDLANGQVVYLDNYAVQKEWSNLLGGPESPAGATPVPVQPLVVGGGVTLQAAEGSAMNDAIVGSFYDPNGGAGEGSYSITIDWGDGVVTPGGLIDEGGGNFYIVGSHAYQGEGGNYQISFNVARPDYSLSGKGTSTAVVIDPAVVVQGYAISTYGTSVQNAIVASFTDPAGNDATTEYQATIDWGDGSTSAGYIEFYGATGVFEVFGGHSYNQPGSYQLQVTIAHDTSPAVQVAAVADLLQPALQAAGGFTISTAEGAMFSNQVVATFTDPVNSGGYSANVDFGDGSSVAGATIEALGGGNYEVLASHEYTSDPLMEAITVTVTRGSDGNSATVTSIAEVVDSAVDAGGGYTINTMAGTAFSQQLVGRFIDPAGADATGSYAANIDWGDGQTTAGTIVADASGDFNVLGGHEYASAGSFTIQVEIQHGSAPAVGVTSQAIVADPMPSNLSSIAEQLTNSAASYGDFVASAYNKYLGRAPDGPGLSYWVGQMQSGVTDEQLESNFLASPEYVANHGGSDVNWVIGMYHDLLGRAPDGQGLAYWTSQIEAGMPEYNIALGFAASGEREAMVVQNDYSKYLLRSASPDEVNYWVNEFLHGARNEDVIAGFVAAPEYYNRPEKGNGDRTTWLDRAFEDIDNRLPTDAELSQWLAEMM